MMKEVDLEIYSISMNRINFRFPGQRLLLSDVSLKIEKGSTTALVGESGSGKSTLVNIIDALLSTRVRRC